MAGAAMPEQYKPSTVLHPVLMRVDQEQKVTKDTRTDAEQDVGPQRYVTEVIREKHEVEAASLAEMENIAVTEETMLESTLQYRFGQTKAHISPSVSFFFSKCSRNSITIGSVHGVPKCPPLGGPWDHLQPANHGVMQSELLFHWLPVLC
ncbi:hypothetical protein Tco_0573979 [Tanacetum coccineum]